MELEDVKFKLTLPPTIHTTTNNYLLQWRLLVINIYRTAQRLVLTKQVDFVFAGLASSFIWRIPSSVAKAERATILNILSRGDYPRIYRVSWTNQSARKTLFTSLVNTNYKYITRAFHGYRTSFRPAGTLWETKRKISNRLATFR